MESTYFKAFIIQIRPSYILPSRKTLSTTLLDTTHNELIKSDLHKTNSVLLIDGWKNENANTKNVAAMFYNSSGQHGFLDAWGLSGSSETKVKLAEIVSKSIAKERYNTDIFSVVSDNVVNMIKMSKIVDIWHMTCNSHTGNLAKELVSPTVANKVNIVLKAFTESDIEHNSLKHGGSRITLPCKTRWCSNRDSFKNLLKHTFHEKDNFRKRHNIS